jgi:beta-lactamase class A
LETSAGTCLHLKYALNPEIVSALCQEAGLGVAEIEIRALPDGPRLSLLPPAGRELAPASMIKVPIAAALCEGWAEGETSRGQRVEVRHENLTPNDLPSPLDAGYRASLEELGRLMLTRSDNVATNVLIDFLGRERISERCRAWGLAATAVRRKLSGSLPLIEDPDAAGRNSHPAHDAATLFERIARGEAAGSPWLTETLFAQEWNDKLSGGLDEGDRFAHKTGEMSEVSHDGGILVLPDGRRYALVVYTALPPESAGERLSGFMRRLRPHLGVRGSAAGSV